MFEFDVVEIFVYSQSVTSENTPQLHPLSLRNLSQMRLKQEEDITQDSKIAAHKSPPKVHRQQILNMCDERRGDSCKTYLKKYLENLSPRSFEFSLSHSSRNHSQRWRTHKGKKWGKFFLINDKNLTDISPRNAVAR